MQNNIGNKSTKIFSLKCNIFFCHITLLSILIDLKVFYLRVTRVILIVQFSSIAQSCRLFVTLWTEARQASLSITNFWSLLKLMSIESVMPSNHLTLCHPLLLLPSIFPSIRVFSNERALCIKWPKY